MDSRLIVSKRPITASLAMLAITLAVVVGCSTSPKASDQSSGGSKGVSDAHAPGALPPASLRPHRGAYSVRDFPQLMWPVSSRRISRGFSVLKGRKPHDGLDIAAPSGSRIYAPADGRVIYAGRKFHGYGKMIIIEHAKNFATIYGHCKKLLVRTGQWVKKGNLIGLVGRTGHATGSHLHFEVRVNREPVDPLQYLPSLGNRRPLL